MPEILASVFAESGDQVLHAAGQAAMAGADWLELRLDRWPIGQDLEAVIGAVRLPVLVTCHTPENGGHFRGTLDERRELLTHALVAGATGLDLDIGESWMPPVGRGGLELLVRSFHSFTGVPRELDEIHARLVANPDGVARSAVAKIVVTAHDLADAAPVMRLLEAVDQSRTPTVAFAMGRTAWPTRLLALCHGAPLLYGALAEGAETAPGQVPVALLRGLYRAQELSTATAIYGLLGNPALHSLGPWLHNRAFRRLEVDGVYLPLETSRPDEVVAMLPPGRVKGLSVTAPHKVSMADLCGSWSVPAEATGVVNTLVPSGGEFVGHNSDVEGTRQALAERVGEGRGRSAVVCGAGGAARAGACALLELGFEVTILGRTLDGVRAFAERHGVRLGSLSRALPEGLTPAVVVNATPLGSEGRLSEDRPLPDWRPAPETVVMDMVYRPHETRFLREARAAGATVVPGIEMFLAQAAEQVQWFTGRSLAARELRAFLAGVS